MPKKFWFDCIKILLRVIIPSIGSFLSFICLFSNDFENSLQNLGLIGIILIFCLLFAVTLILELTGIIKLFDNYQKGIIKKDDLIERSLYSYFKTYKKDIIKQKNKKAIHKRIEKENFPTIIEINEEYFNEFHHYIYKKDLDDYIETNYDKAINDYFAKYSLKFIDIDVLQESFYLFFGYAVTDLFTLFNEHIKVELPELLLCDNQEKFTKRFKQNNLITIINKFQGEFEGKFTGYFILGFDHNCITQIETILEEKYSSYINNYNKMILSFMKEACSMATLSGLTCICQLFELIKLNKKYKPAFKIVNEISNTKLESLSIDSNFIVVRLKVKTLFSDCLIYLYLVMDLKLAKKIPTAFTKKLNSSYCN